MASNSSSAEGSVELLIEAPRRKLDDFDVARSLPNRHRRMVGPFIFVDHIGPTTLQPGQGLDVRPHPHIHLATVTYLFEGAFMHRDSLGYAQRIEPLAINWMTAGSGIVHSERTPDDLRALGPSLHGVQTWVALPKSAENLPPSFHHYPADQLPEFSSGQGLSGDVRLRVLAGSLLGHTSPVAVHSRLFYADARLNAGATLSLSPEYEERGVYVVDGEVECGETQVTAQKLAVLTEGKTITLSAKAESRVLLLGGDRLDGPRYIYWNFVSSSKAAIVDAARKWRGGGFPLVPGDDKEFIPLSRDPELHEIGD